MITERKFNSVSGWAALFILLAIMAVVTYFVTVDGPMWVRIASGVGILIDLFLIAGLFFVNPNEARVLQLFGKYIGTTSQQGLRWANPLYSKKRVSLRVRNFETGQMKVNDIGGNPIEIASIVVWKVVDTAEAIFEVDSYEAFVKIQSEAAVRNLATQYAYDSSDDTVLSLRGSTAQISDKLREEIQARLEQAGVEVLEARISHLAYAPEIAEAMLRRQQAGAIIAARTLIVEGAVGMVEMALDSLSKKQIIELDHERKASMVSNLLVVLCGETSTQPVINTGTMYQ
ncbi:MAG: SPFH domain-containing protein [candidate division Zixibacteria bacterium]|nr:SPFH domain-containing protein [candidate division Zixibacteria bacterium]MDH3936829.1 SPFH domain-containing protein [candidate division Zixibacteria bacterium]MDH4033130.1 SPFH domain-containing protein [candidate division Zixibacteria bacterium]